VIVGVHGIAQQQIGRKQVFENWEPALADGVELAGGWPPGDLGFELAFYGHLFPTPAGPGRISATDGAGLDDLHLAEIDDLVEAGRQVLTDDEIAAAERLPPLIGHTHTPLLIQTLLRAMDAKYGRAAGVLYFGTMRQVRRYLTEPALKARVDAIVDAAVTPDCRVLVGHSLGSVAALEYVRRHPEHDFDLLLTVGSPLALHTVQSRVPVPFFGTGRGIPDNVGRWLNVRDRRDPVACAGDLSAWWSEVEDRHVDNGADAHNIARYLSKQDSGAAILTALPSLVSGQAAG
jgi:hypothetical protein